MTDQARLQVARAYAGALAQRDLAGLEALLAPGVVATVAGWHHPLVGPADVRKLMAIWLWLYPDLESRPAEIRLDGEQAVVHRQVQGTHRDGIPSMLALGFAGIRATGQRIRCVDTDTLEVAEGRIVRLHLRSALVARHPAVESLFAVSDSLQQGPALAGSEPRRLPGFLRKRFGGRPVPGAVDPGDVVPKPGGDGRGQSTDVVDDSEG